MKATIADTQADSTQLRRPEAAGSSSAQRRIRRLAAAFTKEPELILACLHGIEREPPAMARSILDAAQAALAEHPEYADLMYCTAKAAVAVGEFETAQAVLTRAVERNPKYKDALILAARVALMRGQPQRATKYLTQALDAGADYPDVHVLLGQVWRQRGNRKRARKAYERALELNGTLTSARAGLTALALPGMTGKSDELPA